MKKIVFLLMALFTISNVKAATDYAITFSNDETKGTAVANPERATPGETVTITVTPKRGYAVKDVTVDAGYEIQGGSGGARAPKKIGAKKIRQSQGTVEVTKNSDTEFTFTPPTGLAGISFTYNDNTNFLVTITYEEVAILYPIVAADADTIQGCSDVTVNHEEQEIGKDVEITVVPENHYEVDKVWVTAIMEATEGEVPEEGDAKARKSPRKANLHIDYDVEIEATAVEGKENTYSFTLPETLSGGPLADDYNDGTKFIVHVKMNEIPIKYKFLAPVDPNAHGTCTVEPSEQYKGQNVTIKFIPDEGYELEGAVMIAFADYKAEPGPAMSIKVHQQFDITPDMVNADGTYVFTLPEKFQSGSYEEYTENTTFVIAPVFTEKKYNIIADETVENGTIAVDPTRQEIEGKVTITLTPEAGYVVKEGSVKVSARRPMSGEDSGSDEPARVKPRKAPAEQAVQYISQGDITVTKVDDTTYEFTLPQTLPSTFDTDYHSDTEFFVTAEFRQCKFTVKCAEVENGSATADPVEGLHVGDEVTITVAPAANYDLEKITVTASDEQGEPIEIPAGNISVTEYTFTIPATVAYKDGTVFTVTPSFILSPKRYDVIVKETEHGTVTADVPEVGIGETVTLTVTPEEGATLKSIKVAAGYEITGSGGSALAPARDGRRKAEAIGWIGQEEEVELTTVEEGKTYRFVAPKSFTSEIWPNYTANTQFVVIAEFEPAIVLYNDKANETTINNAPKNKPVNVKLAGRTIKKEVWSTICLPFPLTIEGSVLDGADVRKLVNSKLINNNRTVSLTFEKVSETEANYPYIIKVAEDITEPLFEGVTIPEEEVATGAEAEGLEKVWETPYAYMHGNYHPMSWEGETRTVLFLGTDGKFYYPDGVATTTVNSQRAFVTLNGCKIKGAKEDTTEPGDPEQGAGSDVKFYFNIDLDDTPTAITDINSDSEADGTWYDISGRPIKGKPATRGIYINNGHKFIIK